MSKTIELNPVTRIEGHLAIKVEVEDGKVAKAFVAGEMFRGFEKILRGRDPLDAQHITQRICGVCPVEHGVASVLARLGAEGPCRQMLLDLLYEDGPRPAPMTAREYASIASVSAGGWMAE